MSEYIHTIRVPFQDTDMAGIVHYTKILGYVELAEHAALESVCVPAISSEGGFPKVHVDCDYKLPVRFGDTLDIVVKVGKISTKSLHWNFSIKRENVEHASGSIITALVDHNGQPCAISDTQRSKLSELI